MSAGRVEFANALRGPAALAVVASHFLGTFWLDRAGTVGPLKLAPLPASIENPFLAPWLFPHVAFNWGAFGVGLFFLISGFVIPFSLQRYNPLGFLVARAVRILPVYAVGFLIGVASLGLLFAARGEQFPFSPWHIATHAVAGLRAIIPVDRIDGVVWTIEMEIRFYVVCAIVAGMLARGRILAFAAPLFLFGTCIVMALLGNVGPSSLLARGAWKFVTVAALNGPFLMFMFIGVAVNFHFRGFLTRRALAAMVVGLFGLFLAGAAITPSTLTLTSRVSYAVALAVFLLAYRFQGAWATRRPLQFLAAVSYPLYAVHAIVGYVILWTLARVGFPAGAGVIIAFGVTLLLSWVLHRLIEMPSQTMAQLVGLTLSAKAVAPEVSTRPGAAAVFLEPVAISPVEASDILATPPGVAQGGA